jgi:hypothetical protein
VVHLITDRRDIDFVLYEQFKAEGLTKHVSWEMPRRSIYRRPPFDHGGAWRRPYFFASIYIR